MWAEVDGERKKVAWYVTHFPCIFQLHMLSHFDYGHRRMYKAIFALRPVTEYSWGFPGPRSCTCTCRQHGAL
jgi:hypothetical protein